ncbi:MAG: DUF1700 domain-containing protein [Clostridium sp.]|nr:DUF1700 domain-containing protein [Acetatifactor muris]MCM1563159.1 DUF1700 domain-containing protein [Clostridium sp.]
MNRPEFMRQLESLLQNIPQAERDEALRYYNSYFDDAGPESEQDVMEALGNPARVAESIKRDLAGGGYREEDLQRNEVKHPVVKYQNAERSEDRSGGNGGTAQTFNDSKEKEESEMPTWLLVLCIIGGILLLPVVIGLASGLASAILGILVGWFAVILAFGITAFVLLVLLIALVVGGMVKLVMSPVSGMALIGSGLLCGGLGLLFLMLTVAMAGIATPAIFRGMAKLCRYLISKCKNRRKEAIA